MAVMRAGFGKLAHPECGGDDIGLASHYVAVPADRDDESVGNSRVSPMT